MIRTYLLAFTIFGSCCSAGSADASPITGACADGGTAGEQGHGLGRAAVRSQRGEAEPGKARQDDVVADPLEVKLPDNVFTPGR